LEFYKACTRTNLIVLFFILSLIMPVYANASSSMEEDSLSTSQSREALAYLDSIGDLLPSSYWPNIKPTYFLRNLRSTIKDPVRIYPGMGTNFCGYGAITYLLIQDDPLGYARLLVSLYRDGAATYGKSHFNPSQPVKKAAGRLRFKGILDIHPAEQMWYLTLADHYKGYLNLFNRRYNPGDEDRLWAAVNFAKFNRMARNLMHYKINARGADLLRPTIDDLYEYISNKMKTGKVVLFINNRIVHKKNHTTLKLGIPTHFIVAEKISKENNLITFVYWDYGGRTQLQMSPALFKRIIFGISTCTRKAKKS
jgi:hypothetical protein